MKETLNDSHQDLTPAASQLLGSNWKAFPYFQIEKSCVCIKKCWASGPLCLYSGAGRHSVTFAPIYMIVRGRKLTWEFGSISDMDAAVCVAPCQQRTE